MAAMSLIGLISAIDTMGDAVIPRCGRGDGSRYAPALYVMVGAVSTEMGSGLEFDSVRASDYVPLCDVFH